jgi:hypothetical protein
MLKMTGLILGLAGCVVAFGCGQGADERLDSVMQGLAGTPPTFCGLPAGNLPPTGVIVDATADTQLEQALPTTNEGNIESCTSKGGANKRHCLLRFDLTSIPTSTAVKGGCLLLVITDPSAANYPGAQLFRNWSETAANWQRATTSVDWEVPGAWGATDSGPNIVTIPKNTSGWRMIPMSTEAVQAWVTTPSSNYGILFGNNSSSDGVSFSTLEGEPGNQPQIAVWTGP